MVGHTNGRRDAGRLGSATGYFHEGRSIPVGSLVRFVLYAWHAPAAGCDSPCAVARGRIRFDRGNTDGAWAGYLGDRIRTVSGSPRDGTAHETRFALIEKVQSRQNRKPFLGKTLRRERPRCSRAILVLAPPRLRRGFDQDLTAGELSVTKHWPLKTCPQTPVAKHLLPNTC